MSLAGRPREYDRKVVANQLIEWVRRDSSVTINGFVGEYMVPYSRMWQWADEEIEFREILEITKSIIAERREKLLNEKVLHPTAYGLNARVYDKCMQLTYRDEQKYQSDLRKEEVKDVPRESEEKLDALLQQLNRIQNTSKDI